MAGVVERPFNLGRTLITPAQVSCLVHETTRLCRFYDIPVSPWSTLSHAEIQPTLNIIRRWKWTSPGCREWISLATQSQWVTTCAKWSTANFSASERTTDDHSAHRGVCRFCYFYCFADLAPCPAGNLPQALCACSCLEQPRGWSCRHCNALANQYSRHHADGAVDLGGRMRKPEIWHRHRGQAPRRPA